MISAFQTVTFPKLCKNFPQNKTLIYVFVLLMSHDTWFMKFKGLTYQSIQQMRISRSKQRRILCQVLTGLLLLWASSLLLQMAFCRDTEFAVHDSVSLIPVTYIKQQEPELMRLRTTQKCVNRNKYNSSLLQTINSKYQNLVGFINRCNLSISNMIGNMEVYEMWLNDQFGYVHNFKVGGTTVQNTLEKLVQSGVIPRESKMPYFTNKNGKRPHRLHLYNLEWHRNDFPEMTKENFYAWLDKVFLFSYIRDPIHKLLSGFNEMHIRKDKFVTKYNKHKQLSGIDNFRLFLNELKNLSDFYLWNNEIMNIYPNHHIHPQMMFLLTLNLTHFPMDFIGNITEIQDSLYDIINYSYPLNKEEYLTEYYKKKTRGYTKKYHLDVNDLNDIDIKIICDLYWMDYICIPFNIPIQCNLTQLLAKHYGNHVIYNNCL